MLPSPSLGPPLLSASLSPPLFCGIPLDPEDWLGAALGDAAGVLAAGVLAVGVDFPDAPQPASSAVSNASPAADRVRVSDISNPSSSRFAERRGHVPITLIRPWVRCGSYRQWPVCQQDEIVGRGRWPERAAAGLLAMSQWGPASRARGPGRGVTLATGSPPHRDLRRLVARPHPRRRLRGPGPSSGRSPCALLSRPAPG